ncbi:MAG: hypothetical protein HY820_15830 [Acidobacteria bacterium]|nr:hypothetical protein [Acidobacteriota bacterium]
MGIAQELLTQANHLATYQGVNTTQADLRRAVSTAYYALFHLLVEDAGQRWRGASLPASTGIERALDHGPMRSASDRFKATHWTDWHGISQPIPQQLRRVASTFGDLQDARHRADYANNVHWSIFEVDRFLVAASEAFRDWEAIQADPMAGNYLLSMLLGKRR